MAAIVKRALAALALVMLLGPGWAQSSAAQADNLPSQQDLAALQQVAPSVDAWSMVNTLTSGATLDVGQIVDAAKSAASESVRRSARLLVTLLVPVILLAILRQISPEDSKKSIAAGYVCYLSAALLLMDAFAQGATGASQLMGQMQSWIDALFPVLSGLLVACGASISAAAYAPILSMATGVLTSLFSRVGIALCAAASVIAIAGNLSERFELGKLQGMIKGALFWMSGLVLTAFLGFTSLTNLLASGQDSAAMRAAKYAVGGLIPGVGGEVADTMNALSGSAILVKNATGVTGLVALVAVCLPPILRLLGALIALKLCAAITEPLGKGPVQSLIDRFSEVFSMLMVAAISSMVVGIVLVGSVLFIGNAAILPG